MLILPSYSKGHAMLIQGTLGIFTFSIFKFLCIISLLMNQLISGMYGADVNRSHSTGENVKISVKIIRALRLTKWWLSCSVHISF